MMALRAAIEPKQTTTLSEFIGSQVKAQGGSNSLLAMLNKLRVAYSRRTLKNRDVDMLHAFTDPAEGFTRDDIIVVLFDNLGFTQRGAKVSYHQFVIDIPHLANAASFYLADIAEGGLRKYWSEQKRLKNIR
jgi:hypothetical protein